jgi:hypothetical protein
METFATAFEEIRMIFPPKMGQPGRRPGLAEPRVRLTPGGAFLWIADMWVLVLILGDLCPGKAIWFVFVGPSILCNTADNLLCISCVSYAIFLGFRSWVPAYHNSSKPVELVIQLPIFLYALVLSFYFCYFSLGKRTTLF